MLITTEQQIFIAEIIAAQDWFCVIGILCCVPMWKLVTFYLITWKSILVGKNTKILEQCTYIHICMVWFHFVKLEIMLKVNSIDYLHHHSVAFYLLSSYQILHLHFYHPSTAIVVSFSFCVLFIDLCSNHIVPVSVCDVYNASSYHTIDFCIYSSLFLEFVFEIL